MWILSSRLSWCGGTQALQGHEALAAAVQRNIFDGDASRRRDAGALARYVQW